MDFENSENIVNNISKLLIFWNLTVDNLSEKTGLSVSGIYKSMKDGIFKIEALRKIADALHVPTIVLLADSINTDKLTRKDGVDFYSISWSGGNVTNHIQINENLIPVIVFPDATQKYYDELIEIKKELEQVKILNKELTKSNDQLNEIIGFVKRENMFAFANIVFLIIDNESKEKKSGVPVEKLNDITRSKIYDESFLSLLVEKGLISQKDFQNFILLKNAPDQA